MDQHGGRVINDQNCKSEDALNQVLKLLQENSGTDMLAVIRADKYARHEDVMKTLYLVRKAGFQRIAFVIGDESNSLKESDILMKFN